MDMCGMMLIDMHGVTYANNLLKNPATKRLSGKNDSKRSSLLSCCILEESKVRNDMKRLLNKLSASMKHCSQLRPWQCF